MKLLTTTAITLALTGALQAGGLSDPIEQVDRVSPRAEVHSDWSGTHAGVMLGGHSYSEDRTMTEHDTIECGPKNCDVAIPDEHIGDEDINALPDKNYNLPKGDPDRNCGGMTYDCATHRNEDGDVTKVWLTGPLEFIADEYVLTDEVDEAAWGAWIGHRWDAGQIVYGIELWSVEGENGYAWALEPQVGIDLGNSLLSVGAATSDGEYWMASLTYDSRINDNISWRAKTMASNEDYLGAFVGLGVNF